MQVYIEGEILRLLAYRALSDRINAKEVGPEAAIRKMLASPHGQKLVDVAKRSQGVAGLVQGREVLPLYDQRTVRDDWGLCLLVQPWHDAGELARSRS